MSRKVQQYLAAGVQAVWVLDLETRTLTRHAPRGPPRTWSSPEAIIEEHVLPVFACQLGELWGEG